MMGAATHFLAWSKAMLTNLKTYDAVDRRSCTLELKPGYPLTRGFNDVSTNPGRKDKEARWSQDIDGQSGRLCVTKD